MTTIADPGAAVIYGGVDTHADVHVAAALSATGKVLGTESFGAGRDGFAQLLAWLRGFGDLARVGVEGTGSYGAGLARHLAAQQVAVAEVNRPDRARRRRHGKSDPVDAVAAATAALNGDETAIPKAGTGAAESIRCLKVARGGAVKARTQAGNQLRDLIVTAPAALREQLQPLTTAARAAAAAAFTPGDLSSPAEGTKAAMAAVARRWQDLDTEITGIDTALAGLVTATAPAAFLAAPGIGIQTAATLLATCGDNPARITTEAGFAALAGVSPVDASSGKQQHHRLNRGGDRQANSAIWRIVMTRLRTDPRTQAYYDKRTADGKTRKEIIRCLKRYVAREIYKNLIRPAHSHPETSTPQQTPSPLT
jgi:transposase